MLPLIVGYTFQLATPLRVTHLAAADRETRDRWVKILGRFADQLRENPDDIPTLESLRTHEEDLELEEEILEEDRQLDKEDNAFENLEGMQGWLSTKGIIFWSESWVSLVNGNLVFYKFPTSNDPLRYLHHLSHHPHHHHHHLRHQHQ